MTSPRTLEALQAWRADARHAAAAYLESLGFWVDPSGWWRGALSVSVHDELRTVPIRVSLPAEFPDVLPIVRLHEADVARPLAHLESYDQLCLIQTHAATLDTSRPADIVANALERAQQILSDGLSGRSDEALYAEFLAYWERETKRPARITLVTATRDSPARPLHVASVRRPASGRVREWLCDDAGQLTDWLRARPDHSVDAARSAAFFLPVTEPLRPPDFTAPPSTRAWLASIENATVPADWRAFQAWLTHTDLPPLLLLALEANGSALPTLVCAELSGATLDRLLIARAGGALRRRRSTRRVTAEMDLVHVLDRSIRRVPLERMDGAYLTRRGGAPSLENTVVVIVGAGAVGGQIAMQLAAMGVGTLYLIDPDDLKPENAHRHVLGVVDGAVGKALALQTQLERMYPHQVVRGHQADIESFWRQHPEVLSSADVVVFATGDEALERRMGALRWPRAAVHAWVEALGAGGHVLVTGGDGGDAGRGCYECLFRDAGDGMIANRANLVAPDQSVARTLAGCAGFHTPFSALDAQRTALDASAAVVRVLLRQQVEPQLITWRGNLTAVRDAGFRLSTRGWAREVASVAGVEFADSECAVCGLGAPGDDTHLLHST